MVVASVAAALTLVVLALRPSCAWPLGIITAGVGVWLFSTIERPWLCAHDVDGLGGCIDSAWAIGAGTFVVGVTAVFVASLAAVIVQTMLRQRGGP